MGKATGFLEYKRQDNIDRAPLERLSDYGSSTCPCGPRSAGSREPAV